MAVAGIEMVSRSQWRVHQDVGVAVDRVLAGEDAGDELRTLAADGSVVVGAGVEEPSPFATPQR